MVTPVMSGQVCAALTRVIVPRNRHDQLVDALSSALSAIKVGDPFDQTTGMGPLGMSRARDRVESYIAKGRSEGAILAAGGPLMPLSQILLLRIFPKEKAGIGLAIWAMTTTTPPILGPILGRSEEHTSE